VTEHSLEARVADLEAVADSVRLDRFALLAMAQAGRWGSSTPRGTRSD